MSISALMWLLLRSGIWAGIGSLGFAVLFNVPPRLLAGCAMCGAAGYIARLLVMQLGVDIEGATLVGALIVGCGGELLARRWRAPVPIFTVSGVIPMMPGRFAFSTMIGLLRFATSGPDASSQMLVEASLNATKTALILGAIAFGIAAPSLLFQRHRPVV